MRSAARKALVGGCLLYAALAAVDDDSLTSLLTASLRRQQQQHAITYDDTLVVHASTLVGQAALLTWGPALQHEYGMRLTSAIGALLVVISTLASSRLHSLTGLALLCGIPRGAGLTLVLTPALVCCWQWLPTHRGVVAGVLAAGLPAGTALLRCLCAALPSPTTTADAEDRRPYYKTAAGAAVPGLLVAMAVLQACLFACGVRLLRSPPRYHGLHATNRQVDGRLLWRSARLPRWSRGGVWRQRVQAMRDAIITRRRRSPCSADALPAGSPRGSLDGADSSCSAGRRRSCSAAAGEKDAAVTTSEPWREELCAPVSMDELPGHLQMWHLLLCYVLTAGAGAYITAGVMGSLVAHADAAAAALPPLRLPAALLLAVVDAATRVACGAQCDRWGLGQVLLAAAAAQCALLWTCAAAAASGASPSGLALASSLYVLAQGANFVVYPFATAAMWGSKHAGANYNVVYTLYCAAAFFVALRVGSGGAGAGALRTALVMQTLGLVSVAVLVLRLDDGQEMRAAAQRESVLCGGKREAQTAAGWGRRGERRGGGGGEKGGGGQRAEGRRPSGAAPPYLVA